MAKREKPLTRLEIDAILFGSDTSESELSSEDDGWPKKTKMDYSFIPDPDSEDETIF